MGLLAMGIVERMPLLTALRSLLRQGICGLNTCVSLFRFLFALNFAYMLHK
jgi:hypothetical protein